MERLRTVPLKSKVWLREYEIGAILVDADCDINRFVLEIPGLNETKTERWIMKFDVVKESFIRVE